jgi:hypothetical protein
MDRYSRKHLTDHALLTELRSNVANERGSLADVLADIGEIDERKLYVPAAHPSMVSYMVHELRFTEQAALKRLRAARTARKFPAIFAAVANGRLHLTAIVILTGHFEPENVEELVAAAEGKTSAELERWLGGRKSESELALTTVTTTEDADPQLSLRTVVTTQSGSNDAAEVSPAAPAAVTRREPACAAEERSELRCQLDREAHELLD